MAISKNAGRQEALSAYKEVGYADHADDTGVTNEAVVELPAGAVVTGGSIIVTEVFNSTTSDVIDIGDATDPDRYSATPVNLAALGATALDITGYKTSATEDITVAWTAGATGTATTGAYSLVVEYIVDGRACISQG